MGSMVFTCTIPSDIIKSSGITNAVDPLVSAYNLYLHVYLVNKRSTCSTITYSDKKNKRRDVIRMCRLSLLLLSVPCLLALPSLFHFSILSIIFILACSFIYGLTNQDQGSSKHE